MPDTIFRDRRIACAIALVWALALVWLRWGSWGQDAAALYMAAHFWQTGQTGLIYAAPDMFFGGTAPGWLPAMAAMGVADRFAYPFVYPPLWAVLLAPLTGLLSPQGFLNALLLLQIPLLAAMPFLTARIARPKTIRLPVWVAAGLALISVLMPGISALYFNQPTIAATFLVLLSVERMSAGRPVAAGIALAVAAALKLSPALFVLVFVLDRQWRALTAFALAGAALAALSVALAGIALHHDFLQALHHATAYVVLGQSNSSLRSVILIAAATLSGETSVALAAKPLIVMPWLPEIGLLPSLAFALSLVALAPLVRAADPVTRRTLSLLALGLMVPLFGPIGWTHYYLLPMLLAPALPALLPGRATAAPLAALALMLPYPLFLASKTFVPGQSLYIGLTTLGWLWLLVAVIAGARAAAAIRDPRAQVA